MTLRLLTLSKLVVLIGMVFLMISYRFLIYNKFATSWQLPSRSTFDGSITSDPVDGLQVAIRQRRKRKNLVVVNALGARSAIGTVHHNIKSHFSKQDEWDCIIFVHSDEGKISFSDERLLDLHHCSLVRQPGFMWTNFLLLLTPELVQPYQYIAILLDDVFAPVRGDTPVNVTRLIDLMEAHSLSSISPSIKGAVWETMIPKENRCLNRVNHIETFLQIFTQPLFRCWRSHMDYTNPQAYCLDLCLRHKLCPSHNRLAVDHAMVAYHLGKEVATHNFIPPSALVGTNLTRNMRRSRPTGGATESYHVCDQYACQIKEYKMSPSEELSCPGQTEEIAGRQKQRGKNLVVFTALGSISALNTTRNTFQAHFGVEEEFDCIVFINVDEIVIPSASTTSLALSCSVVRLPGLPWFRFLFGLIPQLVNSYEYIAIIRDSIVAEASVNVPQMLHRLREDNISLVTPLLHDDGSSTACKPRSVQPYFQILTSALFSCWRQHLSQKSASCVAVDVEVCPGNSFAVDVNMKVRLEKPRKLFQMCGRQNESSSSAILCS